MLTRSLVLTMLVWVAGAIFDTSPVTLSARTMVKLARAGAPVAIPVPVEGVRAAALVDSWGASRGGGRRHQGIDIFAKRGTPVRSPVAGLVLRVGHNRLGGNVVTILGPGLQIHYFAHLEDFGPIDQGETLGVGDIIRYVGDSGNAKGTPPHLHYGIYTANRGALNPYPLLKATSLLSRSN